mmetsp:Transcript_26340/g.61437  ORF Transcript_26340/g.61437 Transcript_26340/m.61437 type:complete len:475 (-) Transcript_26340:190-1614(-)
MGTDGRGHTASLDNQKASADLKSWHSETTKTIGQTKQREEDVLKAVQELEEKEAQALAAAAEERKKAEEREAAAARRREKEEQAKREREQKRQRIAQLKAVQEQAEKAAEADAAAKAAAEAIVAQQAQFDKEAKEKDAHIRSLSEAERRLLKAFLACQCEGRTKFGVLQVCMMRLQMRERRPAKTELFRDYVDDALDEERKTLTDARNELASLAKACEKLHAEVQDVRSFLATGASRDAVARRRDQAALSTSNSEKPSFPQRSSSQPLLPPLGTSSQSRSSSRTPPSPNHGASREFESISTEELFKKARHVVEQSARLEQKCTEVVMRTGDECAKATAHVSACLDRRKNETEELKRSLDDQKQSAERTIAEAEKRIEGLRHRANRAPDAKVATDADIQAAKDLVQELRASKGRLENDYRHKSMSLKIDESCRNLTTCKVDLRGGSEGKRKTNCQQADGGFRHREVMMHQQGCNT